MKLKWKCKEFLPGIFAAIPVKQITEFLNTLPEERALEAKIEMLFNTYMGVWYREEEK